MMSIPITTTEKKAPDARASGAFLYFYSFVTIGMTMGLRLVCL